MSLTAEQVDHRIDIYAVGILMFQMLTGEVPFHASDTGQLINKIENEPLPSISSIRADIPTQLEHIINKATAKSPSHRFANSDQLLLAIEGYAKRRNINLVEYAPSIWDSIIYTLFKWPVQKIEDLLFNIATNAIWALLSFVFITILAIFAISPPNTQSIASMTITATMGGISVISEIPTNTPTPTPIPTNTPTLTSIPTNTPTLTSIPTNTPTLTSTPTNTPTLTPTPTNTSLPTHTPLPTMTPTPTGPRVAGIIFTHSRSSTVSQIRNLNGPSELDEIDSIETTTPINESMYAIIVLLNVEKGTRVTGYLSSVDASGFCASPVNFKRLDETVSEDASSKIFWSDYFRRWGPWCKGTFEFNVYLDGEFYGRETFNVK